MPADKPASDSNIFAKAANGEFASSYYADGRWNIGGWSSYPSADALAARSTTPPPPPAPASQSTVRK